MSEKKGLSAFLKKNQKKGNKPKADNNPNVNEEVKVPNEDAEVVQSQDQIPANPNKRKDESSDEEEDELVGGLSYGNIKEKKDQVSAKQQDDKLKAGYGFDDKADTKPGTSAGADGAKATQQKKTASDIKFGGPRPKFARGNKGKFGGEFSEGLDDIDDDGTAKKRNKDFVRVENTALPEGTREFVNLGASAKAGGDFVRSPEEEKKAERQAVKPTFRGKLNLTRTATNQEEENAGVVTSYGFNVALRGPYTDKPKQEEGKEGDDRNVRKDGRRIRDKGTPFGQQSDTNKDDDGFEVVQDKDQKRRDGRAAQRQRQQDQQGSDSEDGSNVTKGGFRGNRGGRGGRGGFFKNSRRDAAEPSKD